MAIDAGKLALVKADRDKLVTELQAAGAVVTGTAVKCPWHQDEHASGSIHQGDDGSWRYRCHGCDAGGDVLDIVERARGLDFPAACEALGIGNGNGHAASGNGAPTRAVATVDPGKLAAECAARLQADPAALETVWRTRAVDAGTAKRFGVGISADAKYWTFAVADGGRVVAVKHHRVDPSVEPKCYWTPRGTNSRKLYPVHVEAPGATWVCPGELKALAVIAAGRSAIGITGGETADLPDELASILRGRAVAIVADDDEAGCKWANKAREQLTEAGIDVRIVRYGADREAGLKDIGDVLRQWAVDDAREPEAVGAALDNAYEQSDPWHAFGIGAVLRDSSTWAPVAHVATGFAKLDAALEGGLRTGGVHLFGGCSAKGKTTFVSALAVNTARAGIPTGFISCEMSRRDIGHLILANLSGVPRTWIAKGNVRGAAADRLARAIDEAERFPVTILDDDYWRGPLARGRLASIVGEGVRRFGWRLLVLDYLGLLAPEPDDRSDYFTEVATSAVLKRLASEHQLALVTLADLRKSMTFQNKNKRAETVSLEDFRGAARLTYDATSVFFLDSEQFPAAPGGHATGTLRLVALKTRYAAAGSTRPRTEIALRWHPSTGRIEDMEFGDDESSATDWTN